VKTSAENIGRGFLLACFIIGLLATFHSATRTYITPLLMGVSSVLIVNLRNKNVSRINYGNPKSFLKSEEEKSTLSS